MEAENETAMGDQGNPQYIKGKRKGGRPKAEHDRSIKKVTIYITEEEYMSLTEFAKTAWYTFNYSGAARYLVLDGLKKWVKKGKQDVR